MSEIKTVLSIMLVSMFFNAASLSAAKICEVEATLRHGPQRPSRVELLEGLNVGRNPFGSRGLPRAPREGDYEPIYGDSFIRHNGDGVYNFMITTGSWWLRVGDKPRMLIDIRSDRGAYAQPGLLPDIGVSGKFRLSVTVENQTRFVDEFDSIETVLSPGSVAWTCIDESLGLTVKMKAHQFIDWFGFVVTAEISADADKEVTLSWQVDEADHIADQADYAEFSSDKYARIFVGLAEDDGKAEKGRVESTFKIKPHQTVHRRFVCVWGYSDYNKQGVADAYERLEFKPFHDMQWVQQMKKKWFHHWIGKGLEPEKKFKYVRAHLSEAIEQSAAA